MIDNFYFWSFRKLANCCYCLKPQSIEILADLPLKYRLFLWLNFKAMCLIEIRKTYKRHNYSLTVNHIKELFWKEKE